ncbi:MAG: hypothetical protein ABSD88_03520 [Candidatus Korobacteraceae bacterium]|jgi:hypothetical protein
MSRPLGRLFFCWFMLATLLAGTVPAQTVTSKTLIQDVLYHADGTPAKGTLLISWPAFTTADGQAIPAGSTTANLGTDGSISIYLFPNAGSTPQGTSYTVVLDLDDGRSTEYWIVPQAAQTTVAPMRSRLVPRSLAVQPVGRDYVDTKEPIPPSAASGNLASFDANKYVVDSGKKPSDFAAANASTTVNGQACALGSSCTVYDSTKVSTSTTVNGHALSGNVTVTASDTGLGSVTNDAQTKAAIVPNTVPAAGQIHAGNAGGTAFSVVSMSGDCTLSSSGAITCLKTNGTSFGNAIGKNVLGTGAYLASSSATAPASQKCLEMDTNGNIVIAASNAACGSGGSMTWPAAAGIALYGGSAAWGTPITWNSGTSTATMNISGDAGTVGGHAASYFQAALTNPVTGPGSGATVGNFAACGNTACTTITDSGKTSTSFQAPLTNPVTGPGGSSATTGHGAKCTNTACTTIDDIGFVPAASNASTTVNSTTCALGSSCTVTADPTSTRYKQISCQPGLGDGANAITAATYYQSICYNDTGVTVTVTGIKCYTDNSGSSTMNVTNSAGTSLLTGAITCSSSWAAGTQSATTTLASGDYLKFTFVSDGTTKQTTWLVTETK